MKRENISHAQIMHQIEDPNRSFCEAEISLKWMIDPINRNRGWEHFIFSSIEEFIMEKTKKKRTL